MLFINTYVIEQKPSADGRTTDGRTDTLRANVKTYYHAIKVWLGIKKIPL